MKYLSEYRNPALVEKLLKEIFAVTTRSWTLMEICGGQTHSLIKNGIPALLPEKINLVHGPGCPVCVTNISIIDEAVYLSRLTDMIFCSYGDMLRVPGSKESLLEAKASGADIRILYSPLEAVQLAKENPDKQVVFFAVGFETTAPANALSVVQAANLNLANFSILASHVLVPPAMEAILGDPDNKIDGFLAAGHVCTIMGLGEYFPIAEKYKCPIVVTGFEPVDLLQGILMTVIQLENGTFFVENQYARSVHPEGNVLAKHTLSKVFDIKDRVWRGIGNIPLSGFELKDAFSSFNARVKFDIPLINLPENTECISGEIMKGLKKPMDCPNFGTKCKPEFPIGAPMVSSEGACAAYYHYAWNPQLV